MIGESLVLYIDGLRWQLPKYCQLHDSVIRQIFERKSGPALDEILFIWRSITY